MNKETNLLREKSKRFAAPLAVGALAFPKGTSWLRISAGLVLARASLPKMRSNQRRVPERLSAKTLAGHRRTNDSSGPPITAQTKSAFRSNHGLPALKCAHPGGLGVTREGMPVTALAAGSAAN